MKKTFAIFLLLCTLLSIFTFSSFAIDKQYNWYIKRNGTKQPCLSKEQELIKLYNAYYLDTRFKDGGEEKVIYLTYDAGYENGNIAETLNILKDNGIPAAFFILDNILLKNSDLVTRMFNEGHTVCNHTKNHKNISYMKKEDIEKNLSALEILCEEKTDKKMAKYFRFPEGKYSEASLKCVSELGYKTIFWSFAYDDWDNARQMPCEKAIKKILSNTHNGGIFLFHPTSDTNLKILPHLIKEWKAMGYRFGTLDELTQ